MTLENPDVIDFVAHDPESDCVLLVMVEGREWGLEGNLLPDLERKFDTYLQYVTTGQLESDYPQIEGKPICIELRCSHPPGKRELQYLEIVTGRHLSRAGIVFQWKTIGGPQSLKTREHPYREKQS